MLQVSFMSRGLLFFLVCFLFGATEAEAHAFAAPYTLPVPFWLYAYGSTAALLLSFLILAFFSSPRVPQHGESGAVALVVTRKKELRLHPKVETALRCLSFATITICIVSGLIGSPNPMLNFNMTWFWILFLLVLAYLASVIGDFYPLVSPWSLPLSLMQKIFKGQGAKYLNYPKKLGHFPAVGVYFVLVALELFGNGNPATLSLFLAAYFAWMLFGSFLFGPSIWLEHADTFRLMFKLIGMLAPVEWLGEDSRWRIRLRWPLAGLMKPTLIPFSLTFFILFMISSTAFDGIHDTFLWNSGYWKSVSPVLMSAVGSHPSDTDAIAAEIYYGWQWLCLFLSPFVYLVAYAFVLFVGKFTVGSPRSAGQLLSDFARSLVPIAFFYHVTHYFSVALSQAPQIYRLISDPFGWGWNLFGTAQGALRPFMIDASVVWHLQVVMVLIGHVLAVYIAHGQSFQSFQSRSKALISQIPMMTLMMGLTASGLWILSLPMNSA
ncbi:hypothetical protein AB6809_34490 [Paraburkholderia sp. RCC_158]|uniref:hypothetical protein n=1 Tax=Paraburkholderia sp. RCC_158 TaxID=3239220 RepID=UPI003525EB68